MSNSSPKKECKYSVVKTLFVMHTTRYGVKSASLLVGKIITKEDNRGRRIIKNTREIVLEFETHMKHYVFNEGPNESRNKAKKRGNVVLLRFCCKVNGWGAQQDRNLWPD